MTELKEKRFPQVAFFKPTADENAHPGYSDMSSGDAKVKQLVEAIQSSPYWKKTLIIVTFDEHGGFWDPAMPHKADRWGPGSRIPAIFISPHVQKNHIDRTNYETVSILSFIEKRFSLPALNERDAKADPLTGIFEKPAPVY
jgi:acid phosphatase